MGDVITYECRDGQELEGTALRVCQKDGQWSGDPPICKIMLIRTFKLL